MTWLAAMALIVPTACMNRLPYDEAEYAQKLEANEAAAREFRQHVAEARSARVQAMTMLGKRQKKSFRMSAGEFKRVQEILSHTQAVPPAMGESDGAGVCFERAITLEFLNAEGEVIEIIRTPQWRYMPESAARQLAPSRQSRFYEAWWSLPDDECAEFNALRVLKEADSWIDQAIR